MKNCAGCSCYSKEDLIKFMVIRNEMKKRNKSFSVELTRLSKETSSKELRTSQR